ncbi:MAG: chemotaxis protein CheB, partial [Dokdonella sp.]
MSDPKVAVALLSQSGELARHLREALAAAGVPLVYEAVPAQLDRPALEQSGAVVVVVNLDNEVEAQLDDIYALLDDDRYNVIFNEGQVSSQLSGWELARWARHLAAKITGANDID